MNSEGDWGTRCDPAEAYDQKSASQLACSDFVITLRKEERTYGGSRLHRNDVVSYLTARPNRDVVIAGHQQTTHEWWDTQRDKYELCVSLLVHQEAGAGDPKAAQERLEKLSEMTVLDTTAEATGLAQELVRAGALPKKAGEDALHIAVAAVNRVKYLLTWNCRHMANATMRPLIEVTCAAKGLQAPIICTPDELLGAKP